jgi:peroxisomal 3,2-trans-enoyl-CoA isomerase
MTEWGIVNRVFPVAGFHVSVLAFLEEQLDVNDGKSMMEAKRLQNTPLRAQRLLAVYEAADALAERFVEDAPKQRFLRQREKLSCEWFLLVSILLAFTHKVLMPEQRNLRGTLSCETTWSI